MLWFVGLGLTGYDSISLETQSLLKDANYVYVEEFTSPIPKNEINKIKKLTKGQFKAVKRWMVEDGKKF